MPGSFCRCGLPRQHDNFYNPHHEHNCDRNGVHHSRARRNTHANHQHHVPYRDHVGTHDLNHGNAAGNFQQSINHSCHDIAGYSAHRYRPDRRAAGGARRGIIQQHLRRMSRGEWGRAGSYRARCPAW